MKRQHGTSEDDLLKGLLFSEKIFRDKVIFWAPPGYMLIGDILPAEQARGNLR